MYNIGMDPLIVTANNPNQNAQISFKVFNFIILLEFYLFNHFSFQKCSPKAARSEKHSSKGRITKKWRIAVSPR